MAPRANPALEAGDVTPALRDEQQQRPAIGIAAPRSKAVSEWSLRAAHHARCFKPRGEAIVHQPAR